MTKLNSTQRKLLDILKSHGSSYTLEELASMLDLSNKSSVHYNVKELIKKGYLKINPSNPSDYIVLDQQDTGLMYLPLYTGARCGPNGKFISDNDATEIAIPSRLFPWDTSDAIAMRTEGDSMEPNIPEGSVVLVDKLRNLLQQVEKKCCLVVHQNMPLIKVVNRVNSKIILTSYNQNYNPILADPEDLYIVGQVRGLIHTIV